MEQSARFWNRAAETYARSPITDAAAYQRKLSVTRDYLHPEMDVLELGCGTGSTALAHAPFVKHIDAIDFSSKMIDIAETKAQAANIDNVTFDVSTIDQFIVPDQTFDAVLGLSILHLLKNREEVIAKVYRWLQPGGVFVTNTVCLGEKMKYLKLIGPIGRLVGLIPLVKVFTASELEKSLSDAGFVIDYHWQPNPGRSVFMVAIKPPV